MDALILADEQGNYYAIPDAVVQQCRVPAEYNDRLAKAAEGDVEGDVEGFGWVVTYDASGDFISRVYTPLTWGTSVVRLSFDVPIISVKFP